MVVLHLKSGGSQQGEGQDGGDAFLYETSCATPVDALIAGLAWVWNTRLQLKALASGLRTLLLPAAAGADSSSEADVVVVAEEGRATLEAVAADIEAYLSKELVARRVAVRRAVLEEKLANAEGAVAIAVPDGLPEAHPMARLLRLHGPGQEGPAALEGTGIPSALWLDAATAELWAAGKSFQRGQMVGDRVGMNEKTKLVAKLQPAGQGPPPREPVVSEAERTAMLAYYFKRQEELKRLAEADDDAYLASEWADGKGLQRSLRGVTAVRAPGVLGVGGRRV